MTVTAYPPPDDSDWIPGDGPMSDRERFENLLAQDPGCYLRDSDADAVQPFAHLETAMMLPPAGPEASIRDAAGRCLAHADQERAAWIVTQLGAMHHEVVS